MSRNNRFIAYSLQLTAYAITLSLLLSLQAGLAQEDFVYDSKGKHNPFIPLVTPDGRLIKLGTKETVKTGPVLEGIIYDGEGVSFAIINGEIVKEGDIVGDYLVVEITRQKVTFEKEGQITQVPLEKEGE